MGRIKFQEEKKKKIITLNIEINLYEKYKSFNIKNNSKFFNFILEEYFNMSEKNKYGN